MLGQRNDRWILRSYFLVFLAHTGVSYLLICFCVAPPFTLIGEVDQAGGFRFIDAISLILVGLFLLLALVSWLRWPRKELQCKLVAIGVLVLLAGILTVAAEIGHRWRRPSRRFGA